MGGRSKQKGAQFEREVCRRLSSWITQGAREDLFWRSAMSGGRATLAARRGKQLDAQAGDISAVDPAGGPLIATFFVECKFYSQVDLESWIYSGKGNLRGWWTVAEEQARQFKKAVLLIVKGNNRPALILTNSLESLLHTYRDLWRAWLKPNVFAFLLDEVLAAPASEVILPPRKAPPPREGRRVHLFPDS
jgi:hypothetical protein